MLMRLLRRLAAGRRWLLWVIFLMAIFYEYLARPWLAARRPELQLPALGTEILEIVAMLGF